MRSRSLSEAEACFSGMRAMRATTFSISGTSAVCFSSGEAARSRSIAPASSSTSMALSGSR